MTKSCAGRLCGHLEQRAPLQPSGKLLHLGGEGQKRLLVAGPPGRLDAERQAAIATPLYDAARARARIVDRTLPPAGVPFALEDLGIGLKGVPIHGGSR